MVYINLLGGVKNFYLKRYKKLYLNYWKIWIIFIPIGILFFDRTFELVYKADNYLLQLLINILGLQYFFNFYGYNATWWFISLIIGLYLIFPVIYYLLMKINKLVALVILLLLYIFTAFGISFNGTRYIIGNWFFSFILPFYFGAFLAKYNFIKKTKILFIKKRLNILLLFLVLLCSLLRFAKVYKTGTGSSCPYIDTIFAYLIIQYYFNIFNTNKLTKSGAFLEFIGRHSFNIFLFHSFLFLYFIPISQIIYFFKYPFIILPIFLFICIFISYLIEKIIVYFKNVFEVKI